jgi:hypothetical protein
MWCPVCPVGPSAVLEQVGACLSCAKLSLCCSQVGFYLQTLGGIQKATQTTHAQHWLVQASLPKGQICDKLKAQL